METNNIIYCRVTKRNKFYMGRGMMTFGVAGTNGTDSTFILKLFEVGDDDASLSDIPASALSEAAVLTFSSSFFFASFCFFFACAKFIKYVYTATSKPSVINAPAFVWKKE